MILVLRRLRKRIAEELAARLSKTEIGREEQRGREGGGAGRLDSCFPGILTLTICSRSNRVR